MAAKKTTKNLLQKDLYRSETDRVLFGLFGGLAEYLSVNATVLRLSFIAITAFTGFFPGIVAYVLAVIVVPEK